MLIGFNIDTVCLIADCDDLSKVVRYSSEGPDENKFYCGVIRTNNGDFAKTEYIYNTPILATRHAEIYTSTMKKKWNAFIKRSDAAGFLRIDQVRGKNG